MRRMKMIGVLGFALGLSAMSASASVFLDLPPIVSVEGSYAVNVQQGTVMGPVTIADGSTTSYINRSSSNISGYDGSFYYGFQLNQDYSLDGFSLDFYPGQEGFHSFEIFGLSQEDDTNLYYAGGPPNYGHFLYPAITGWTLLGSVTEPGDSTTQLPNHVEVTGLTPLTAKYITMTWTDPSGGLASLSELGLSVASPIPEPTSLGLLSLSIVTLLARRGHRRNKNEV